MLFRRVPLVVTLAALSLAFSYACSSSSEEGNPSATRAGNEDGGTDPNGDSDGNGSAGASAGDGATTGTGLPIYPGSFGDAGSTICGDSSCVCANGLDDDDDGKIDGLDEECTGPLDNDEGSFATGIPGDNRDPKWQDCFFDGNSGAGDDGCRYHTECLTGERELSEESCSLTQACIDFCRPLTPNGCDCFGCCEVQTPDETVFVHINTGCDFDDIDDEGQCPRCVQTTECMNNCGECELCPGKTIDDLPPTCGMVPTPTDGGPGNTPVPDAEVPPPYECDNGETVCTDTTDCGANQYCQFGCCIAIIFR